MTTSTPPPSVLRKLTAQDIYDELVNNDKILEVFGRITFDLADVNITVKQKDVVGNIIQEWLAGWMEARGIYFRLGENSQMPPDFFLSEDGTENLLEVKAFNRLASPAFDIADFKSYYRELLDKPYMLHVDYLIFGYEMTSAGEVVIRDLWLKKVWEITRRMGEWPLNLQIKQGVVQKIRPCTWYSTARRRSFAPFRSFEDFVAAIEETVYRNPDTRHAASTWLVNFKRSYEAHYRMRPSIPRWSDIEHTYVPEED